MPKEYIDRDKILLAIEAYIELPTAYENIEREIGNIPPADVAPVVHGEWEWYEKWIPSTTEHPAECQAFGWRCGNCKRDAREMGFGYWDDPTEKPLMIYCPVCGAKMDGGT